MNNESKVLELAQRMHGRPGEAIICGDSAAAELRRQHAALQDLQTECAALRVNEENLTAQVESLRAQLAARVPDGWKLVPVEPTPEMESAAMAYVYTNGFTRGAGPSAVYASMLSAAPSQQAPVAQGEPYGCVTVVKRLGCAEQHFFFRHPNPPYLDNASECVTVYTHPQRASEPMTDEQIDRALSTVIPGGSQARDWFLPHESDRGLQNVRQVVRLMIESAAMKTDPNEKLT